MDTDIKYIDLRNETLNTIREAMKIASHLGSAEFVFYVKPTFVSGGFLSTKLIKLVTEAPPAGNQLLLNYMGLKNLKKTVDFAKSVLVNDGEAFVEEKHEPVVHTASAEALEEAAPTLETTEETETETTKKRGRKKALTTEEVTLTEGEE
jgi:hypothetical protein